MCTYEFEAVNFTWEIDTHTQWIRPVFCANHAIVMKIIICQQRKNKQDSSCMFSNIQSSNSSVLWSLLRSQHSIFSSRHTKHPKFDVPVLTFNDSCIKTHHSPPPHNVGKLKAKWGSSLRCIYSTYHRATWKKDIYWVYICKSNC